MVFIACFFLYKAYRTTVCLTYPLNVYKCAFMWITSHYLLDFSDFSTHLEQTHAFRLWSEGICFKSVEGTFV